MGERLAFRFLLCFSLTLFNSEKLRSGSLVWENGNGFRSAAVRPEVRSRAGFSEFSGSQLGIWFTNTLSSSVSITNQIFLNGSGVATGDVDGDGLPDLYFCGVGGRSHLYRNLGQFRFEEITDSAGVACQGQPSTGAALVDTDGDGDLDLLVNGVGTGTRLFLNDARGKFSEASAGSGLRSKGGSTSLALADIDGDGRLDIYVVNYRTSTLRDEPGTRFTVSNSSQGMALQTVNGRPVTDPELAGRFVLDAKMGLMEQGESHVLYHNEGGNRFSEIDWTKGAFVDAGGRPIKPQYDWGLSAMFRDVNQDGAPDLYVCNDFQSPDHLWINDGTGKFRAGLPGMLRHTSLFSMGVDFGDLDRDGLVDFFVVDMLSRSHFMRQVQTGFFNPFISLGEQVESVPQYSRNTLFWNRGGGRFSEVAELSGLQASDWSWCPVFLDVDLDGWEDILVVTGHERDAQNQDVAARIEEAKRQRKISPSEELEMRKLFPRLDVPNYLFRNLGGLKFEERGEKWGFQSKRISQGICLADLDLDGDLDVIINCLNDEPLVYRNESQAARVAVKLRGLPPNSRGIGARITVSATGLPVQSQEMMAGGRYLSSDEPIRSFASGRADSLEIVVRWRSGRMSTVSARPNRIYEIFEPEGYPVSNEKRVEEQSLFEEEPQILEHQHTDHFFDDFLRQPLLPRKLSSLGPAAGWFDFDHDGWPDLMIGAGRGGSLGLFRNNRKGGFEPMEGRPWNVIVSRDITGMLGWRSGPDKSTLLIAQSNYEDGTTNGAAVRSIQFADGKQQPLISGLSQTIGALALGDADGDGDLDLFAAGRVLPGRYPVACPSLVFENNSGNLQPSDSLSAIFKDAGMVSDALWCDLDGNGSVELVLACEAGPIRIFRRENGVWKQITEACGLDKFRGFWNSVTAGDFDGDGKIDLVCGNWGRNSWWQELSEKPLIIFHGDLNRDGVQEVLESHYDRQDGSYYPWRDFETLGNSIPFLKEQFITHEKFARASTPTLMGSRMQELQKLEINFFDSAIFLNRGKTFEVFPLPVEAQLAPTFGISVADFNGDGDQDLILAQNFFGVAPDRSRLDAGNALLLLGNGKAGFRAMNSQSSGIDVAGEGRSVAAGDFNRDRRLDFVVTQNGRRTKLYRNTGAKPGFLVQLKGPVENPDGIGAVVRIHYRDGTSGPAFPVLAGGGYWSQASVNPMIVGISRPPAEVEVVWPGGKISRQRLRDETFEIQIEFR